jgi:hypothetical protein
MPLEVQDAAPGQVPSGSAGAVPARRLPAPETARAYAMDWQAFVIWCQAADRTALPAAPATVAAFLAAAAETLSAGALGRRAAAISDRHRQAGFPPPTADPAVRAILRPPAGRPPQNGRHHGGPASWCAWPRPARATLPGCVTAPC